MRNMAKCGILFVLAFAGLLSQIDGRVKVSFKMYRFQNTGHKNINGGCCDFLCDECDNYFNICFDRHGSNNAMSTCAYWSYQTDKIYQDDDDFYFPSTLTSVTNPIVFTINSYQTGFRSKIEVWDKDNNAPDKVDYYGQNYVITPARTAGLATENTVTLNGAGSSTTIVKIKVYCDVNYYGTSTGCDTYCLARDNSAGHYDCNINTGAKICHPGWEGSNCHLEIDECDSNPCQYGGACTDLLDDYICACPPGTTGKNCDYINVCQSGPCQNNGVCHDSLNLFTCTCPQHYGGVRCEYAIDPCDSDPCMNGATCLGLDSNAVIECVCAPGFSGEVCDVDIDECHSSPCINDGTCIDMANGFLCNCPDGFSGQICESDIRDECASNPCENSATCVDLVQGYVCMCPPGFHSDNCENEVNECNTNPCVHGVCQDEIAGYTCTCSTGYTGTNCTENIDECIGNDCKHSSTCVDGVASYTCSCVPGYTGSLCEVDTDECEASPCVNGRCEEGEVVNDFTCDCTSTGFTGPLCEEDVDECLMGDRCPPGSTCVNEPGSYRCGEMPVTTPLPGLCRTSVCYNYGTCTLIAGRYECVCTEDFTGEMCEIPTEPCNVEGVNPCQNGGFCRVNTAENGTLSHECKCEAGFIGNNCQIQLRTGTSQTVAWYMILIVVILTIIIAVLSFFVHRFRKRSARAPDEPAVVANPHTEAVSIQPTTCTGTLGATAAPASPSKISLDPTGSCPNNIYQNANDTKRRNERELPTPPPYSVA